MILNINDKKRINYDNIVREDIVEERQSAIKIKFTFVNNDFIVLLMTKDDYANFKVKTANPKLNRIIDVKCSVVELLKG